MMKKIGDTIKWKTLNGTAEGVITGIQISYIVKTEEGKDMIVWDKHVEPPPPNRGEITHFL